MSNVLVIASQEVLEEPLKLCNAIKIPAQEVLLLLPHIVLKCLQVEFVLDPPTN